MLELEIFVLIRDVKLLLAAKSSDTLAFDPDELVVVVTELGETPICGASFIKSV